MWLLLLVLVAAGIGLSPLPERRARLAVIPVVLLLVTYQAITSRLI